jgi:HEAT repeat protein
MPFIKREPQASIPAAPAAPDFSAQIAALTDQDADRRWSAARALGGRAEAVAALASALQTEPTPRVREAIMTALMRVGDEASVRALLPYLRAQDAGQRAAAIEALQSLPDAIAPFMATLFRDQETDVRILAAELVRNMPAADATKLLCGLLASEQHPNVCAAAIDVLAEVGTRDAIPVLEMCGRRFAAAPFLPFAVSAAIAQISGAKG